MKLRVAVFASGGGSNLQALLDRQGPDVGWEVVLLVSDRERAGALDRARACGVAVSVVATRERSAGDVARDTLAALQRHEVDVVLLAGYLKLVPPEVVRAYAGRMLNIHPALLPAFGGKGMYGMHVHRAVIEAGVDESGATVHFVDHEYDRGPILAQARVPVHAGDTAEALAERVLAVEHRLYAEAVDLLCTSLAGGREPTPMIEESR